MKKLAVNCNTYSYIVDCFILLLTFPTYRLTAIICEEMGITNLASFHALADHDAVVCHKCRDAVNKITRLEEELASMKKHVVSNIRNSNVVNEGPSTPNTSSYCRKRGPTTPINPQGSSQSKRPTVHQSTSTGSSPPITVSPYIY